MPPYLRQDDHGVYLQIKLQPRASTEEICDAIGTELKIKVKAPPVDAAANEALLRLLVEKLRCSRASVQLLRGHKSRHKTVFLAGLTAPSVIQLLGLE